MTDEEIFHDLPERLTRIAILYPHFKDTLLNSAESLKMCIMRIRNLEQELKNATSKQTPIQS